MSSYGAIIISELIPGDCFYIFVDCFSWEVDLRTALGGAKNNAILHHADRSLLA